MGWDGARDRLGERGNAGGVECVWAGSRETGGLGGEEGEWAGLGEREMGPGVVRGRLGVGGGEELGWPRGSGADGREVKESKKEYV